MKISRKLYAGFATVIALAVIVGIIGIAGMQKLKLSEFSMYEKQVVGMEQAGKAAFLFEQIRFNCRLAVISSFVINSHYDDKKGVFDIKKQFESNVAVFRKSMEAYRRFATTDEMLSFHEHIMDQFENGYLPAARQIIDKSINDIPYHNGRLHIYVMLSSITDMADRIANLMTGMTELNVAIAKQTSISNAALTRWFIALQMLLLVLALAFAVFTAFYIVKSIMAPINESADVLNKIAAGNFDARVTGNYGGEFAIIKDSLNIAAAAIKKHTSTISGAEYASRIQNNLLPPESVFEEAFSDYHVIWKPRDTVGGDIYWIKNFDEGTVLCVCDCTGHGISGALLTMLVVSVLEGVAVQPDNCSDTANIIWKIDERLVKVFKVKTGDGCDLAVLFIARDGSITLSAGHTNVFVCNGKDVQRIRGQKIFVGDGNLSSKDDIKTLHIPANPDNKFYIASDGLFDQPGGEYSVPFGYKAFEKIILENHDERQSFISGKIWTAFEEYRGTEPRVDDFELITFKPQAGIISYGFV